MKYDSMNKRITHCHAIRITEPGQGDQPVIVEWKVPDPEPRVPSLYGSHITVSIAPNMEPPVYMQDIAPEFAYDYRIVADGYTSSVDLAWTLSDAVTISDNGYLMGSDEYGVEFWLRTQPEHDFGPGRPFDFSQWTVYRFARCTIRSTVNFLEWSMIAYPDKGVTYTRSVLVPIIKSSTEENE